MNLNCPICGATPFLYQMSHARCSDPRCPLSRDFMLVEQWNTRTPEQHRHQPCLHQDGWRRDNGGPLTCIDCGALFRDQVKCSRVAPDAASPLPWSLKFSSAQLAKIIGRVTKRLEFIERRDGPECQVSVDLSDLVAIRDAAQQEAMRSMTCVVLPRNRTITRTEADS